MTFNGLQFSSIHRQNNISRARNFEKDEESKQHSGFEQEIHISKDYTAQVYQIVSISILISKLRRQGQLG